AFEGRDLATLRDHEPADLRLGAFGFVFQQFNLIPTLTAVQNVEVALAPAGVRGAALRERAQALLAEVGLAPRAAHLPAQMSGGEQQRVAIARALATEPRVILADEPTGNLDSATGADVIDLLSGLAAQHGATVVVATHDAELAAPAPRRIATRRGKILSPVSAVVERGLRHARHHGGMTSRAVLVSAGAVAIGLAGAGAGAGIYSAVGPATTTTVVSNTTTVDHSQPASASSGL